MGRGGGGFRGGRGGSCGGAGKPNRGLFGFFKPKPLGGEFKTEQDITNWFQQRGVKKIGRVEINPEPDDYLDYRACKYALQHYAESLRECKRDARYCSEIWLEAHRDVIAQSCGILISRPSEED